MAIKNLLSKHGNVFTLAAFCSLFEILFHCGENGNYICSKSRVKHCAMADRRNFMRLVIFLPLSKQQTQLTVCLFHSALDTELTDFYYSNDFH